MAKSKRLEMVENTFGRDTTGLLAFTEFFYACFENKSGKVLDRLADTAGTYLPSEMQTACREDLAPNRRESEQLAKEFTAEDTLRARGLGISLE